NHAQQGQVILGTDSHTCSVGAVGAFADGIGATEMAGAWLTGDVRIKVPATWRFNLKGKLNEGVMAKDVMLSILSDQKIKSSQAVSKVFEFAGKSLCDWTFDEIFVLPNMSVEGGAFTGIVEPKQSRTYDSNVSFESDPDAQFEEVFNINLSKIVPMVATPGDPRNGIPISEAVGTKTDAVYIGSCTGGKFNDLLAVAKILKNKKVKVPTYIQASSMNVRKQAEESGLIRIFEDAGAEVIDSGCGDCCNMGFGVVKDGQTIVSDTNRNFPKRMGNNNVYLVNPEFAAIAAIKGELSSSI
ncbi:MAG TPA: aconitase family protein, partial [Patescibacteria group bacterium]